MSIFFDNSVKLFFTTSINDEKQKIIIISSKIGIIYVISTYKKDCSTYLWTSLYRYNSMFFILLL